MNDMKKYYTQFFKQIGDPEFEELSEDDKEKLFKTIAYSAWQFRMSIDDLGCAIRKALENFFLKQQNNK